MLAEWLAITGDASDNVPGIPGVGPKTATKLLSEYGSLEAVLSAAPAMKASKRKTSLIEFGDQARLALDLVRLKEDVPVIPDLMYGLPPNDGQEQILSSFINRYELRQLSRSLKKRTPAPRQAAAASTKSIKPQPPTQQPPT